jgi:hypothetical protein
MDNIEKYNEFINSDEFLIKELISSVENTNISDPEKIANTTSYKKVVSLGKKVIPFLIERKKYIWNIALKQLTGSEPTNNLSKSSEITTYWLNWAKENGY